MQARARSALVRELVRNAEHLAIRGRNDDARLKKRMKLMGDAESQVVAIIQLNEPEYFPSGFGSENGFGGRGELRKIYQPSCRAGEIFPPLG